MAAFHLSKWYLDCVTDSGDASIAYVDEDQSELSRRIIHAFLPPFFQPPQLILERDIVPLIARIARRR